MALILGTNGDDTLFGIMGETNKIKGFDGDDYIVGGDKADLIYCGAGNDRANGGDGNDFIWGGDGNDYLRGGNSNDIIWGENGNDWLLGDAGDDTLYGGEGNDILDGGSNKDMMYGEAGDDTYYVDIALDGVHENPEEGHDHVLSSISYTLPSNVEDLTLTGSANLNGTGNDLNNNIGGNSGNNTLIGNAGNDWLEGRDGDDTYTGYFDGSGHDTIYDTSGCDTLNLTGWTGGYTTESQDVDQNGFYDSLFIEANNLYEDSVFIANYYDNATNGFGAGYIENIV